VQQEGRRCSRPRADVLCSPGKAYEGAGCPLKPLGTTPSRSPHATMEEPTAQCWIWPERGLSQWRKHAGMVCWREPRLVEITPPTVAQVTLQELQSGENPC